MVCCQFGVSLLSVWCQFGVSLLSVWCQFGVSLVSVCCQFGVSLRRCEFVAVTLFCFLFIASRICFSAKGWRRPLKCTNNRIIKDKF